MAYGSHPHAHGALPPSHSEPVPRLVFFETTGACNLQCVHCRRLWDAAAPNELSTDEVKGLIDQIAASGWHSILVFSGGEPLMRPDLFELLDHARSQSVTAALATNGTLIDATIAAGLAAAGISRVSVSLDGASARTHDTFRGLDGSFDQAVRGIQHLRQAGVQVQINVTMTKRNQADAAAMVELVRSLDACALHVFLLVPVGCGVELPEDVRLEAAQVERLLTLFDQLAGEHDLEIRATCAPQAQRIRMQRARARQRQGLPPAPGLAPSSKGCLAGGSIVFVDAVGKVFPCGYMPVPIGSIREQTLATIVKGSAVLASLRDITRLEGRCHGCEFAPVCGGCRARALGTSGDLFGPEPSCPM